MQYTFTAFNTFRRLASSLECNMLASLDWLYAQYLLYLQFRIGQIADSKQKPQTVETYI